MTELITNELFQQFFSDKAKLWQKYINYDFIDTIKLSDTQIKIIDQEEDQMLINGIPGSGKSILLLYKFFKVLNTSDEPKKLVYVTFNKTLVNDVYKRISKYKEFEEYRKKNEIYILSFHELTRKVLKDIGFDKIKGIETNIDSIDKVNDLAVRRVMRAALQFKDEKSENFVNLPEKEKLYKTHTDTFLRDEILWIKANGLITLDKYLNVERTGRGNAPRVVKDQRKTIFKIFENYEAERENGRYGDYERQLDMEDYALLLLKNKELIHDKNKYDYIFIDEIQDFQPMQLMALKLLYKEQIVAAGDTKQRIYKKNLYSFAELGLDFSGRKNKMLNENFRSTKEIMSLANTLNFLDEAKNSNVKYVNSGERPVIKYFINEKKMYDNIRDTINKIHILNPKETVAIINRAANQLWSGEDNVKKKLLMMFSLSDIKNFNKKFNENEDKQIFYSDMFSVKGLEFDHVIIMNFNNKYLPNPKDLEKLSSFSSVGSEAYEKDKENLLNDEKKLLYVAMTRARKTLTFITPGITGIFRKDAPQFITEDFGDEYYDLIKF